jgi:hypothetical protein
MIAPIKKVLFVSSLSGALLLSACSTAPSESEREAGLKQVQACFTNKLIALVDLETIHDGSGKRSLKTLSPGETACVKTTSKSLLAGEIRPGHETQAYAFRFENISLSYPQGVLIVGNWRDAKALAPGTCEFLSEGEMLHLDSGTTHFDSKRLEDTDLKRFTVTISPTQSRNVPSQCSYLNGGPPIQ